MLSFFFQYNEIKTKKWSPLGFKYMRPRGRVERPLHCEIA